MEDELRRSDNQHSDFLAIDAFSGDSVPANLLTEEAFAIYLRQISPNGVIAVHISDTYLDLGLVVKGSADRFGLDYLLIDAPAHGNITGPKQMGTAFTR